jgi:L-asparagine transporter-like permease
VIAAIVAALHALALLVIWVILGRTLSRQRNDRQGDLFDSLVRATTLLTPAYITGLALVLVAASVNFSERRWLPIVVTVWALLLGALALSLRRLRRLLDTMRVARRQRGVHVARILVPVLIAGILGIGLAGLAMQVLLRQ